MAADVRTRLDDFTYEELTIILAAMQATWRERPALPDEFRAAELLIAEIDANLTRREILGLHD